MKNGLPFLRIIGGICLLFLIDSESFGQCSQCLSNVLILNTGVNQETSNNAFYGTGSQDDFWTLIQGPSSEGPYPKCAYSRGASSNHINGALNPCCDVSASPSGICDGNMTGNANDCHWGGAIPYVFERRFCVNTGTGNPVETAILNISKVYVDLDLAGVTISGPTGNFTVDNTCHEQSAGVFGFSAFYFPVKTGVYYLRFTVGNDWGNGCNIIPCWNVPTYMALEVDAFITSGAFTPIFTDNKHFGKFCNVNYVSFEAPKFSSACAPTGATDLQIQITNYVNTNGITYDISPAPNSINLPYFIGNVGTEYTVTVQDSKGCSLAKKIKIVGSPTLTVTPKVSCYTDSLIKSTDSIKVSTADGAPDYIYTIINGNLPPNLSTSIIVGGENESINLPTAPGFYTITVTDMNGCSATSTAVYNLVFPPPINPVPDVCLGSSITLTAQTPASVPPNLPGMPYQYNWLVPVNSNTNPSTYTPLVVGPQTYTCQVTSAYGCTSTNSATHIVYPNPVITVTNNNAPCNPVFTATFDFTTPLAYWGWVGTPGTNFGWSSVPSVSVTAPSGSVPNLLNTTFTVYCIDQHGCESSYIGNYNEKPFCCNSQQLLAAGTHAFSSNAAYANGNASSIISAYTSTTITTNNYILFDGDIVIDQSLNFVNCPNIRFDPNCLIHVTNGATLRFTNCYLEASCNYMWKGIIANTPNEKVVLQNSTVRSMDAGVVLTNGAGIDVSDCIFQNNFNSIELNSTPSLYNLQTGNCSIIRSLFESDGLSNLLPPHSNQLRGENGIRIVRPRNAEIGRLVNDEFNVFRNLYCGINIIQHNDNTAEYVKLNNNKFDNIQDEPTLTSSSVSNFATSYTWAANNVYRGCAIRSAPLLPVPSLIAPTHRVYIHYLQDMASNIDFYNCDKAVVGQYTTALIDSGIVDFTLLGYMFQNSGMQRYNIAYNRFGTGDQTNILRAIYTNSNNSAVCSRYIHDNIIRLRDQPVSLFNLVSYPVGIFSNTYLTSGIYQNQIYKNDIGIFSEAGVGINVTNGNNLTSIKDNVIHIFSGNPSVAISPTPVASGIFVTSSIGVQVTRNKVIGNGALISAGATNDFDCIRINNSQDCVIECNDLKLTKYGLRGISNCHTGITNIRGNKFTNHGHGIQVQDLGSVGTFGDIGNIGNPSNDNNNAFSQAGLAGGFSVFHLATFNLSPGVIYTSPFTLSFGASGPTMGPAYLVQPLFANSIYECPSFPSIYSAIAPGSFDYDFAMDIVNDSIEFTNLPDNIRWVSERDLFEDMFNDSTIRLSNPALQQYYDDLMNTPIGNIVRINALIQLMNDSSTYSDSVALSSIITEMESINNNLMNTSNVIESNEYFVNKLFIQMGRYPSGEMSSSDSITLETLASSCPFDAGPSVYKARVLYALIDPSRDYNDWAICHENGLYKGGNEEQIDDNIDSGLLSRISDNAFYLYPNPASTQINIDYILANGETAELSIRDITGRIRKVVTLYSFMNQIKLDIKSLESGVYIYQYKTSSGSNRNGKLNIQ